MEKREFFPIELKCGDFWDVSHGIWGEKLGFGSVDALIHMGMGLDGSQTPLKPGNSRIPDEIPPKMGQFPTIPLPSVAFSRLFALFLVGFWTPQVSLVPGSAPKRIPKRPESSLKTREFHPRGS